EFRFGLALAAAAGLFATFLATFLAALFAARRRALDLRRHVDALDGRGDVDVLVVLLVLGRRAAAAAAATLAARVVALRAVAAFEAVELDELVDGDLVAERLDELLLRE